MRPEAQQGERKTRRAIVKLLKTDGALDSTQLAKRLGLTAMAVRQHLYALHKEKLVTAEERPVPIGRPAKYWQLTREADSLFPEAYAELNVALIDAVKNTFGTEGLNRVLVSRCQRQQSDYSKRIRSGDSLKKKLTELARVRTEEGYMAEVRRGDDGSYLLVENHCPICAAANACQGFCSTELDLFRSVLGPGVTVERVEHIVSGDQRCAYRVTPQNSLQ
ncbi:MAG TPA: metalloregulator ArsR/SmtB family transcription factor [Pyrinomonadaceae bacterium]|nr:metalloregulator ArsR/SmtB family transcription factor [Pyrinomonadaceae bacterium]